MTHTKPMRHWPLIAVLALAVLFGATGTAPTAAHAASLTTPFCPASIAPATGVVGDRTSIGLDDGTRGVGAEFAPGELIVVLQPERTAADLRCLAHELRAIVIEGGVGKRGFGGVANAAILQLQRGVSVERTATRLLAPRYRTLILTAVPATYGTLEREDGTKDPMVNDPLFPYQWGLSNVGIVPKTNINPFPDAAEDGEIVRDALTSKRRYGIRVRQAWGLLARSTAVPRQQIKVAIVDNSLVKHPDLEANVAPRGSARYTGQDTGTRVELLKTAGKSGVSVLDTWSYSRRVCPIEWDMADVAKRPDPTLIARQLAAQTNANCDPATPPTTWHLTLDNADRGSLRFSYGGAQTAPIDIGTLWRAPDGETTEQEIARYAAVARSIEAALLTIIPGAPTSVAVTIRRPEPSTEETGQQEMRIVLYGNDGALTVDTSGIVNNWRYAKSIDEATADGATGDAGLDNRAQGGTFRIRYSVTIANLPNQPGPLAVVVTSDPIAEGTSAQDVKASLQRNVPDSAVAAGVLPVFDVSTVPGYRRMYQVEIFRPVSDVASISEEKLEVVDVVGVTAPAPTSSFKAYRPTGTSTAGADGATILTLRGMPNVGNYSADSRSVAIGVLASENAITTAFGQWPGAANPGDNHGQFIAGVIGATAGNDLGMTGLIGRQLTTKTNIQMYGLVTTMTKNGLINMLEYGSATLNAHVVNYSVGSIATPPDLYDPQVARAKRNDVLRSEDPMPATPESLLMGGVGDASRTLFVISAGNDGADLRRPVASIDAIKRRIPETLPGELRAEFPNVTQAQIDAAVRKAIDKAGAGINAAPCRPKGMGIRQRPFGIGSRASIKGGTLSMLQMPDGTYDRGNILCVASADWNGNLSLFSNWGPGIVDVAAPGQNIVGTSTTDGYWTANGTSFAAPAVAGIAAMVYSVLPDAQPWLVKCAILSSATTRPLRTPNPFEAPFRYLTEETSTEFRVPYPDGSPLTVNGMVQASEAIDAAIHLDARVRAAQNGTHSWPTCVQKRSFFGGWKSTPVLK
jgi:hypothetical protein